MIPPTTPTRYALFGLEDREPWDSENILTAEERHLLQTLPSPECQSWISARVSLYERRIQALRAAHNDIISPVHRQLPPEVLLGIFSWNCNPHSESLIRHLPVLHVCRTWRQLILRTPDFWASTLSIPGMLYLSETDDTQSVENRERLERLLELSAPRPFRVSSIWLTPTVRTLLQPHLSRVSALVVEVSHTEDNALISMLKLGMPMLQELSISHHDDSDHDIEVLGAEEETRQSLATAAIVPRLRSLKMPGTFLFMHVDISAPALSSLTVLGCLCGCQPLPGHDVQDMLTLLHRYPLLTHFEIQFHYRATATAIVRTSATALHVRLPHLQHLHVGNYIPTSFVSALASRLSLPPEVSLSAHVRPEMTEIVPLAIRTLPMMSSFDHVVLYVRAYFYDPQYNIKCFQKGRTRLRIDSVSRLQLSVGNVLSLFPPTPSVSSLNLEVYTADTDAYAEELLRIFSHLTHLSVKCGGASPKALMQALCHCATPSASDAAPSVPCPALKSLEVSWAISLDYAEGFPAACDAMSVALAQRAALGARMEHFKFSCSGLRFAERAGVEVGKAKGVRRALKERIAPFVDRVAVKIKY